jgi:hypothetical protein
MAHQPIAVAAIKETLRNGGRAGLGRVAAVCSDAKVLAARDLELGDGAAVTIDPEQLAALTWVPGRVSVLCTYQSLEVFAAAHAVHGLLADHQVLVVVVSDAQVRELTETEDQDLRVGKTAVSLRILAAQIAVLRAGRAARRPPGDHVPQPDHRRAAWAELFPHAWQMMPTTARPATALDPNSRGSAHQPEQPAIPAQLPTQTDRRLL